MTDQTGKFARIIEAPSYGDNMLVIFGVPQGCGQFEDKAEAERVVIQINAASDARMEAFRKRIVEAIEGLWMTRTYGPISTETKEAAIKVVRELPL